MRWGPDMGTHWEAPKVDQASSCLFEIQRQALQWGVTGSGQEAGPWQRPGNDLRDNEHIDRVIPHEIGELERVPGGCTVSKGGRQRPRS